MDLTDWTLAFSEDAAGRRGIWYKKTPLREGEGEGFELEICGGREGDDHYLHLFSNGTVSHDALQQLLDCLNTQSWVREEKLHAETCNRKDDPVVAELLKELEQASQTNTDLWDRVRNQQVRINDLLRALAEKPELARYAVITHLRTLYKEQTADYMKVLKELDSLKRSLAKRGQERAEGER
jgi:hypothetical protein